MIKTSIVAFFLCLMIACSSPGFSRAIKAEIETSEEPMIIPKDVFQTEQDVLIPPHTKIAISHGHAQQPNPPKTPATVVIENNDVSTSSGEAAKEYATDSLVVIIIGIILFIAGAAIWLAKRQALKTAAAITGQGAFITRIAAQTPKGFGIALMGIGLALIGWTQFVDILSPWIALAFILVVIPFIIVWYFKMVKQKDEGAPIKPLYPQRNDV